MQAQGRRPIAKRLALAALLNLFLCGAEIAGGLAGHSLSLLLDAVHNLSDEAALLLLWIAFTRPEGRVSTALTRVANAASVTGLVTISVLVAWQAIARLAHPVAIEPGIVGGVGALAVIGNLGVALILRAPAGQHDSVRLAYLHNLGDAGASLVPVAAGLLAWITGSGIFDPLLALLVAGWILFETWRELRHRPEATR
jgi:cobalt-zinc-cadmium efflux system protein